jgi:hypothetical protein
MFLASNKDIRKEIECLMEQDPAGPTKFAVAFWGRDAERIPDGPSWIICDLYSGFCNPETIAALLKRSSCRVFYLNGLHAKVVVNKAGAVVSSANMSHNGLGREGIDDSGTVEAGHRVAAGTKTHDDICAWFDRMWEKARPVTELDLRRAELIYDAKNHFVPPELLREEDVPGAHVSPIAAHELLEDDPDRGYRMRAVKPSVLTIAKRVLPGIDHRMLGKVATYACHAILCRTGAELSYTRSGKDPGGPVTEAWIAGRFQRTGPQTKARVEAVLLAMTRDSDLQAPIRRAAADVHANPIWADRFQSVVV